MSDSMPSTLASPIIAPSILSADFSRLGDAVEGVARAGADWIHLDVMDGRFVPNLTFGPPVIRALRERSEKPFDCHLMIEEPEKLIPAFAEAGCDMLTVHAEACLHLDAALKAIRDKGIKAGVAINPATPETVVEYVLERLDLVLVMTVNPGFAGQKFLSSALDKIARLKAMIGNRPIRLSVDGGVDPRTAEQAAKAGANVFVAGSSVFTDGGEAEWRENITKIRQGALPLDNPRKGTSPLDP